MGEAMLKISLVDNARQRRLIVEGKLIAPWAAELRSACEKARAELRGRELVVEMKHISTISPGGEGLILELINGGIRFRCHGVFTKHVVKELLAAQGGIYGYERVIERSISSSGRGSYRYAGREDFRGIGGKQHAKG